MISWACNSWVFSKLTQYFQSGGELPCSPSVQGEDWQLIFKKKYFFFQLVLHGSVLPRWQEKKNLLWDLPIDLGLNVKMHFSSVSSLWFFLVFPSLCFCFHPTNHHWAFWGRAGISQGNLWAAVQHMSYTFKVVLCVFPHVKTGCSPARQPRIHHLKDQG